jgi:hypothetical protein
VIAGKHKDYTQNFDSATHILQYECKAIIHCCPKFIFSKALLSGVALTDSRKVKSFGQAAFCGSVKGCLIGRAGSVVAV